jgi:hypothetical protein
MDWFRARGFVSIHSGPPLSVSPKEAMLVPPDKEQKDTIRLAHGGTQEREKLKSKKE